MIQTLPPVLTGLLMLLLVAGLHTGVRGAVLSWTLAHVLTALYSLATTRDIWQPLPVALPVRSDAVLQLLAAPSRSGDLLYLATATGIWLPASSSATI